MYLGRFKLTAFVTVLCLGSMAKAVLGGDLSTVQQTRRSLPGVARKATTESVGNGLYTVQEVVTDGISVREFAGVDGKIFAVSWRGVAEPDLESLLGSFYTEYKSENTKDSATRASHKNVATSAIEVRRSGHMRDKRGLAFITERVPAGLKLEDLQ